MRKIVLPVAALACMGMLHAQTATRAVMNQTDDATVSSFDDASRWTGGTDIFPDPEVDYFVGSGRKIYNNFSTRTFAGRSLIIGDAQTGSQAVLALRTNKDTGIEFTGDVGLVLGCGTMQNYNNYCTVISGAVVVASTQSRPFAVTAGNVCHSPSKCHTQMEGSISSGDDSRLMFTISTVTGNYRSAYYRILSDMRNYLGVMEFVQYRDGSSLVDKRVTVELGDVEFAGTMKMGNRTTLESCAIGGVTKIRNLEFDAGSAISLRFDQTTQASGLIEVDGTLSLESTVQVRPSRFIELAEGKEYHIPLLKAPAGMTLSAKDFEYVNSGENDTAATLLFPYIRFEVIPDETGRDVLWAKAFPHKTASGDDKANVTGSISYDAGAPATVWPDGAQPQAGFDYYTAYSLRTPKDVEAGDGVAVFAGESLTVRPTLAENLAARCATIDIRDFRVDLANNSFSINHWGNGDKTINRDIASRHGVLTLRGGSLRVVSDAEEANNLNLVLTDQGITRIESAILGNGNIRAELNKDGDKTGLKGYVELAADNSRWKGCLTLARVPVDIGSFACLRFTDAKNLGGPMDAFARKALSLGEAGRLWPLQSVTLAEPTRGFHVGGDYCQLRVDEGIDFTLLQRMSFWGTLTKTGTGKFALGGNARPLFGDLEDTMPEAGKNRLVISEGSLAPLSAEAFQNLAVSFAEGTRIVLGMPEPEFAFATRGMDLTGDYASLELPESGVQVAFDDGVQAEEYNFSIPVCTVNAANADAVRGKFLFSDRRKFPNRVSEMTEKTNEDGTVTFAVTTKYSTFVICIR